MTRVKQAEMAGGLASATPDDARSDGITPRSADLSVRVGLGAVCSEYGNGLHAEHLVTYIRSVRAIDHGYAFSRPDAADADRFGPGDPGYEIQASGPLSDCCIACDAVEAPYMDCGIIAYPLCDACTDQAKREAGEDAS